MEYSFCQNSQTYRKLKTSDRSLNMKLKRKPKNLDELRQYLQETKQNVTFELRKKMMVTTYKTFGQCVQNGG